MEVSHELLRGVDLPLPDAQDGFARAMDAWVGLFCVVLLARPAWLLAVSLLLVPYATWKLVTIQQAWLQLERAKAVLESNAKVLVEGLDRVAYSGDGEEDEAAAAVVVNCAFDDKRTYPAEHMLLNAFQGLDFTKLCFDTLSRNEQDSFAEFKSLFPVGKFDYQPDDFTLALFLQADDYNQDKAQVRLESCLKWRHEFGLDEFIRHPNAKLLARYRQLRIRRMVGFDRTGRTLVVEKLGALLSSEEVMGGGMSKEDWLMCYSYDLCETMAAFRESTQGAQTWNHRINYLGDLSGGSVAGVFKLVTMLNYLGKSADRFFPECGKCWCVRASSTTNTDHPAGNVVLINAPSFAAWGWNLVKKVLDPKLVAKIKIMGSPDVGELVAIFGREALPRDFGGDNPYPLPAPIRRMSQQFQLDFPL